MPATTDLRAALRTRAGVIAPPAALSRLRSCSAEDLVIYKLVAGRARDIADIEGIVRRQATDLDVDRIRRYGALFAELKEARSPNPL